MSIRRHVRAIGVISAVLALPVATVVSAMPPYDGWTPMRCAIQMVMVCDDPLICVRGTAATANLPPVITVDVGQRVIGGGATGRTATITSTNRDSGRLLMHGTEGIGLVGWTLVIKEDSGEMLAAVVGREGGMLMFGSCGDRVSSP